MKRYIKSAIVPLSEEDLSTKRQISRESDPEILEQLFYDNINSDDWETKYFVCLGLAQNPNTPREILMQLASNWRTDSRILQAMALNPAADIEILQKLKTYKLLSINSAIAQNPNVTEELLFELANYPMHPWDPKDDYSMMLCHIASNPKTPPELLAQLATNEDPYVRSWVARNPHTPLDTLKLLLKDANYMIQSSLGMNPNIHLLLGD